MISTRNLSNLPAIDPLRRLMQSIAALDAILCPDWESRYFSFNRRWGADEQMGSMRNGQGDHYFAFFNTSGCWIKGFCHESPRASLANGPTTAIPTALVGVPSVFSKCLSEPAFVLEEVTFCIWRTYSDILWHHSPTLPDDIQSDGSESLLSCLDGRPETYQKWAEEYFERELSIDAVRSVFAHCALNQKLVAALNDERRIADLKMDMDEIGYPIEE
jgi:hypothetical protein